MSTRTATADIHEQIATEARTAIKNAAVVGAARRGEFGHDRMVEALSAAYKAMKAQGSAHCPAIRAAAMAGDWTAAREIIEQAEREQIGVR
jgi:hypothetical protein